MRPALPTPIPPPDLPIDIVGFILAAMSVLVVFQLFSVEAWLSAVSVTIQKTEDVANKDSIADFDRREVASLIRRTRIAFPLLQAILLLIAIGSLGYINLLAASRMPVDHLFTVAPTLILCGVILVTTASAVIYAQIRLTQARRL